jgi:tetratricopeptide (TPR) repeat protein
MPDASPGRNEACPCGSGKKFKHCCHRVDTVAIVPSATVSQAVALIQQGRLPQAKKLLTDLVNVAPRDATVRYLLGVIALQTGQPQQAVVAMRHACELGLVDAAAQYHLGCALVAVGNYADATIAFKQALVLKPDFLLARSNLANCYFEQREFALAEANYRQTLEVEPGNLVACHNLGQVFYASSRVSEAVEYFSRATQVAPAIPELWSSLAAMQEVENKLDDANSSADTALALEAGNLTACVAKARVLRRQEQSAQALVALDAANVEGSMPRAAVAYWAERGQILESLGRHREAFEAYSQSKALLAQTRDQPYSVRTTELKLQEECVQITSERVETWSFTPPPTMPIPLFIVGFPRSGTTLVEQMLGCHSLVVPCGELETCIEREAGSPTYPGSLTQLSDTDRNARITELREEYLSVLRGHVAQAPETHYATDKLPLNLMRIGLIRILFPEAKIIHVQRHPLDAVISAYFTPFQFGNDWSLRLQDTAHMYVHSWRHAEAMRKLPGMQFFRLRYEDLVANPEPVLRQALGFLDIEWEPACLAFNQSKRVARTASYAQVTKALYQTSKNRYRPYLAQIDTEVLSMLKPVIEEAGYDI